MYSKISKKAYFKPKEPKPLSTPQRTRPQWRRVLKGKGLWGVVGAACACVWTSPAQDKFDGFYAGGSVGYLQQNTTLNAQQDPTNPKTQVNRTYSQRGLPVAEFFLGWGKSLGKCFYVGLEGKVDWVQGGIHKVAEDTNFIYFSGRKNPGIAVLARLGYLINPQTMIYGGVGAKLVRFGYNVFEKADQIPAPFSKRTLQFLTEAGVETSLPALKNWAIRFSYSFMPKKDMTQTGANFPTNHMYQRNGSLKIGTAEHAIKLGLVYHF